MYLKDGIEFKFMIFVRANHTAVIFYNTNYLFLVKNI